MRQRGKNDNIDKIEILLSSGHHYQIVAISYFFNEVKITDKITSIIRIWAEEKVYSRTKSVFF